MTKEEKEQTGKYVLQMARLLEDGCYQQEMLIKAVHIIDEALEQEPKMGRCKDCKYFEYDSLTKVDGIKLIFAHEICSRWGDGCKTVENGYCYMFSPR